MSFGISQCKIPQNFRCEIFDSIDSTNDECMRRALSGDPGGLWIVASHQTAGRGRRSKVWDSNKGNLYSSLLLIDNISNNSATLLPFATAVAIHSVITSILPVEADIKIKWPNDLLISKRKVAGILIETIKLKNDLQSIIIGIGINIEYCPKDVPYPVTFLNKEGVDLVLIDVLPILFQEMEKILIILKQDKGREEIMRLWRCFAYGIGDFITINLPNRSIKGRFIGVDDFGYMLLEKKGSFFRFFTGEVFE
ncbi:biotin--[acetyl-CoA-carboxylase] ligase [Candidatus Liberibacter americanus]|uniref:biotin--[biotin carboxyl-carrier protein] ligase n=1 Tax=Candidatus Liberibacter americanus str. Sao Paulo TaxID=1261131 RepID=U6B4C9_9HYPH|nr:biotin--[acetyl-CoA-carboxylase] ligase [Candidatus Liberibacter americanus]AHA27924.1 Biotin-(acetyl-CoA carboxylase) ligase [Candidatus Liberibacter americanus str. Sao Paulo]EMS36077.1 birA bifunctional protein [Candidatus Liberibacter americanus PW_SP]